jgi:hypothetical protein
MINNKVMILIVLTNKQNKNTRKIKVLYLVQIYNQLAVRKDSAIIIIKS